MENILKKIIANIIQHKEVLSFLLTLLLILPLFAYFESVTSILSWFLSFGLLFSIKKVYSKIIIDVNYFWNILFISFVVLSIFGLIHAYDSYQNFGELFGSRHDDSDFFYTIVDTINNNNPDTEKWVFEYLFAGIGLVIGSIHFYRDLQLLDLLPFSWALAALSIALSAEVVKNIIHKSPPYWLIFITLLGNYVFVKNSVLFYRESLLLCFAFSGWLLFLNRKTSYGFFWTIWAGLLRGANAMLNIFFFIISILTSKFRTRLLRRSYIILFLIFITMLSVIQPIVDQYAYVIYSWARPFDVASETEERIYGAGIDDIVEMRQYDAEDRDTGGQIASKAGGTIKFALDIIMYMFFPIAFHPVVYAARHGSVNITMYVNDAFFMFSFVEWLMVLCWIIVIPYLLYGLYKSLNQSNNTVLTSTTIVYIISVVIIAFFRGHTRHTMYFIMLNPVFVTYAYYLAKESSRSLRTIKFLKFGTVIAIIGYNFLKYL